MSPTIMVTDLLKKKISPLVISGFVILNAETVRYKGCDNSIHFALKLWREENRDGFIKGFTDNANSINSYKKVESVMKLLFVDKLILFPRIRKEVKDTLND